MEKNNKLDLKATIEVDFNFELYRVIDFLNKNLKNKNVILGLSKSNEKMVISIYET